VARTEDSKPRRTRILIICRILGKFIHCTLFQIAWMFVRTLIAAKLRKVDCLLD